MNVPKIKISQNGPYLVSGKMPLYRATIMAIDGIYVLVKGDLLSDQEHYALCRCGHSNTKPFCDGHHASKHYQGQTTASKEAYLNRAYVYQGKDMDLLDDDRCAYARFCHQVDGSVWDLIEQCNDDRLRKELIIGVNTCPAGRLSLMLKNGQLLDEDYEPCIYVVEDPSEDAAAGLYVVGNVQLIDEENQVYEWRNRFALCRCGESTNKPFCDATHIPRHFKDL